MSIKIANTYKILAVGIYISLAFGLEFLYREPLFDKSLEWEKQWQANSSKSFETFFKILTHFGSEAVVIPFLFICLICLPLNKSYTYTCALVYSVFIDNLLKILYGNPRPFWKDPSLFKSCDGGFGNPSGHSFTSSTVYLSFWQLMTDYPFFINSTIGFTLKIVLLILAILLIITIMLTRIFLGVHSVNQVLYGASLGIALYYVLFHIIELQKWNGDKFFKLFREKLYVIGFSVWYAVILLLGLLVYGLKDNDTSKWDEVLNLKCPNLHEYRKYNNDGLFGMLVLFVLIGSHYGIMLLIKLTEKQYSYRYDEINCWYKSSSFIKHFYRILTIILFALPIVLNAAVPSDSSLAIVYIFKISIPYLFATFGIFGPAIMLMLKWKIGNLKILDESVLSDIENAPQEMK
jgi:membrane-associated phospholipid phosphatase